MERTKVVFGGRALLWSTRHNAPGWDPQNYLHAAFDLWGSAICYPVLRLNIESSLAPNFN